MISEVLNLFDGEFSMIFNGEIHHSNDEFHPEIWGT